MGKTAPRRVNLGNAYLDLVKKFPLTSIRNDEHLHQAQNTLDSLFALGTLNADQEAYLEALSDLIEVYESHNVHIDSPDDATILTYLMGLKEISQSTLASETGIQKSTISEVLSGKRQLTRQHIARLAKYFGVGQNAFSVAAP
jgi:HTH-type transcriptional regulator/antitoxin HigA